MVTNKKNKFHKGVKIIALDNASSEYRFKKGVVVGKSEYKPFIPVKFKGSKIVWAVHPDEIKKDLSRGKTRKARI